MSESRIERQARFPNAKNDMKKLAHDRAGNRQGRLASQSEAVGKRLQDRVVFFGNHGREE